MQRQNHNLPRDVLERAPIPALTTINGEVVSVVYVTAPATFTGVIGGYTISDTAESSTATQVNPFSRASVFQSQSTATSLTQSKSSTTLSRQVISSSASSIASTTLAATALLTSSYDYSSPTNTGVSGASSTDSASSSSTGGLSIGAQIGIAVGVILGVSIAAGLILLLLARKKRQQKMQAQAISEKKDMGGQPPIALTPTRSNANQAPEAPRLSLRPVSDLAPEFMGGARQKNRNSQGNMLAPINEAANARNAQPPRPSADRPRRTDNPFKDPENPFADPEKATMTQANTTNNAGHSVPASLVAGAVSRSGEAVTDQRISGPSAESFPLPQSQPSQAIQPAPGHGAFPARKPAPAIAPIAMPNGTYAELPAAPSPVVAQGPGPEASQGNVYRILLDFRPTMEDELELRAGQLVRLLHEYDDGWALCIRMDRSQQGVVPRTCLAAKPSKPRAGPPPPMGPNSRPMTPQGRPRGPPGPPGFASPRGSGQSQSRAQSPATAPSNTGAFNQSPRPLSPGPRPQPPIQKRSMSPGPYGAGGPVPMAVDQRRRSNSVNALPPKSINTSPTGPSKLGPAQSTIADDGPGLAI